MYNYYIIYYTYEWWLLSGGGGSQFTSPPKLNHEISYHEITDSREINFSQDQGS